MPRFTYKLIPDGKGGWNCVNIEDAPPPDPKVFVIEDTMSALEHPCDGKYYTSKHTFEAVTRAHGCETVGERPGDRRERSISLAGRRDQLWEAFSRAYDDLRANKGPEWRKILNDSPKE